jgi:C-terminal processing protease CtpA/Prc
MVVGGPAFKSRQIFVGDRILKVDGLEVDEGNYEDALLGSDVPGTQVTLTICRESDNAEVSVQ